MRKGLVIGLWALLAVLAGFRKKTPARFDLPGNWPRPEYNFRKHPLSDSKIALGRRLFYDPVLSRDSTISCASCHAQYSAFTHVDHNLSHGIDGKIGTRNSPVLVNLAWSKSFMWDGAVGHLDEQAVKPISNPLEMDEPMDHVVQKLRSNSNYRGLFYDAFGDSVISSERLLQSLSQFMLTLVSANAKYDSVMRGAAQFSAKEGRGYALFKKNCASCHTEPLFTNGEFENNGLVPDDSLHDIGRMKVTGRREDSLKFKVPTLRNIELSGPYMHDGRFKTLNLVLNNYIRGVHQSATLSPKLAHGIYLSPDEKTEVIAFLLTLTDRAFLKNPNYGYPGK